MATALLDDLGQADDLGTGAHDDQQPQAAVVFESNHLIFYHISHFKSFLIACLSERSGGKLNSRFAASLTSAPM